MNRILFAGFLLFIHYSSFAQKEPPQAIQVRERLYVISGLGGNVAFLITDEGALVVDSGNSPSAGKTILQIIKEKTDKPVKFLIITHYHSDHTYGMQAFPSDVISIGQNNIVDNLHNRQPHNLKEAIEERLPKSIEKIKKNLAELKANHSSEVENEEKKLAAAEAQLEEFKTIRIINPIKTFERDTTLILGSDTIELSYPGSAHTTCNMVVNFRTLKVLHTGDLLFNDMFPFIAWQDGSDTKNWINSLRTLANNSQIEKVIPGHGSLTNKDGLLRAAEYLTDLRAEIEIAMKEGKSLDEMKKSITMPKYANFKRRQGLVQNIESIYHEMEVR